MKPENYAKLTPAAKKLYDDHRFEFSIVTDGEHAGMMRVSGWKKTMKRPEPAVLDEIKTILLAEKAERDAEEAAKRAEAARIGKEREARRAAIPGVKLIEKAREEWDKWHDDTVRAIDNGDGIRPAEPKVNIEALKEQYPRAAALLKAESYSRSANYAKASAGSKARERIIDGEDYEKAIADMEQEWTDYCHKHMWD